MRGYPIELKELSNNHIANIITGESGRPYLVSNWYTALFDSNTTGLDYTSNEIAKILKSKYGKREIMLDEDILDFEHYIDDNSYKSAVSDYCKTQIDCLYIINWRKYESYWNALIDKEYNPIWNIDGSETRTIKETQTGYKQNEKKTTGTYQEGTTTEYSGKEKVEHGGFDNAEKNGTRDITKTGQRDITKTGQRDIEKTGKRELNKTGDEVSLTVPMENDTFYNTNKTHFDNVKDTETFTNYKDTETFTNYKDTESFTNYKDSESFNQYSDKTTYNSNNTKSFDSRKDTTVHRVEYDSQNGLTDTIKESVSNDYEHKTVDELIRGGNIGVTKSQDLVESEMMLRSKYDFMAIILSDIANYILYMN